MTNANKKIEILTYFNHHHKILYDLYFKPTYDIFLKDDFELITHYDDSFSNHATDYGYTKKIWQEIIVNRFDIIINHIKSNIDNNTVSIFSDIDVIFFGNFYTELMSVVQNTELSLWHMPEDMRGDRYYINGGFFVFRHSLTSIGFFETIKDILIQHSGIKNDQPLIQEYLRSSRSNYSDILPHSVFNANNVHIDYNLAFLRNGTLKAFHATSTHSVYSKILILNTMTHSILPKLLNYKKIYE